MDEHYKATHPVRNFTSKSKPKTGMPVKDDTHSNLSVNKDEKSRRQEEAKRKTFKLSQGFFTKMMIITLAIGRCVSAKSIDGLTLKNEIRQEHAPGSYGINHDKGNNVKIEEEVIKAYNCEEGGTANAKISLNPPPRCNRADGSAYEAPLVSLKNCCQKATTKVSRS